jgi:hypothetical protein
MPEFNKHHILSSKGLLAYTLLLMLLFNSINLYAQEPDSSQLFSGRRKALAWGSSAGYTGMLLGLNALWYSEQPRSPYHFFDDSRQWMMMDKAGHTYSAYHLSRTSAQALRWAGMPEQKAHLYGSLGGWLMMLPIEILDGFSTEYGASWSDLAANSAGSLLYGGQMLLWQEVRIKPKFSFRPSPFAKERPNTLGHNLPTQLLKDYNGQTYWLSVDLEKFLPAENAFPAWLNIAFGYGSSGMVYAYPEMGRTAGFNPYQQFYLAPDLDLSRLRSKKKLINWLIFLLDGIHLPAPALEYSGGSLRLHPLYF